MCWEEFVKWKQSAAWLIWRRSGRFVLELQIEDNKSLTGISLTLFLRSASKISSSSTTSPLLFFASRVFGLVRDNLNHGDVDDDLQTNLFTCFGPVNNQSCWWYELQTDLFTCICTRDKQWIMMMTYGFFSDEVDDGSISLNLRGSGDLQFTTLIMSSLMISFAVTTSRILSSLSFSFDCSVQGEHTHFWREREDGQFDSEAG